jgi:hypothetical protein
MATQDFGLSYTVEIPALYLVTIEGKIGEAANIFFDVPNLIEHIGEASNIFSDLVTQKKSGEAANIFFDLPVQDMLGEAANISGAGLCTPRIYLGIAEPGAGPSAEQSTLVESGGQRNILNCG